MNKSSLGDRRSLVVSPVSCIGNADATRCMFAPARALADDPEHLILDEPHSELDLFSAIRRKGKSCAVA